MNGLKKFTEVLARVIEVCNWVAMAFMVAIFVLSFFPGDVYTQMFMQTSGLDMELNSYGYEVVVFSQGAFNLAAVRLFVGGAFFIFGLMAMIFRNVALIIKTMRGENENAQGATPFQADVTRMIREIGIFSLIIVGVELLCGVIGAAVIGPDMVESSLNLGMLMIGLLMLCLSSAFEQGEELQHDVDGLV